MKTFKFKKGVYIVNHEYLTKNQIDSYKFELYIGENKQAVKKQYDKCHGETLKKHGLENTIQDVTLLRICQVLEKLKYMEKSHYFNIQDITVLNWLENEFKTILKETEESEIEKSEDNKKELKKEVKKNANKWSN